MKQSFLATIPLLCAAISPLSADAMGNKNTKANANQPVTTQPTNQITPPTNPMVTNWADPYLTADFIWWRMQEDGLEYGFDPGTSTSKGKVRQPRFKYEPGFKVGFGLKLQRDGWDFYTNYTWLRINTHKSTSASASSTLVSNYFTQETGLPTFVVATNGASAHWRMHLNVLDWELGRDFWISRWLTLRPQFGMKFSWNPQKFSVTYNALDIPGTLLGDNLTMSNKLNQFGVGIRTGLDAAWFLGKQWCIFGEFAYTGLFNYFNVKRDDTASTALASTTQLNTKYKSRSVTGVVELSLGLRFETTFWDDEYLLMFQAGWEEQMWLNQNQFFSIGDSAPKDLTFEGLTIKAGFDF